MQTIPTELLRCVPGNSPTGNRITGMHAAGQVAGCGAQLRSTARLPSQFRQSLPAVRVVTHKTEASVRVSPQSVGMEHLDAAVSPSHPSPRKSTPTRMKPSRAVSYTADTRHRALEGALLLSEGSSLSPGKRLHHQRSSSSHDASPHPQGERPAPVAGKFSDIGYGIVGQRRCRTRRATRRSRRQIHQWGCRAPRLCERERRGSSKFGRSGPRYPPPSAAHSSFGTY